MKGQRGTYTYYDYINNYSSRFMNLYQSGRFLRLGRSSHYLELLRLRAVRLRSNSNWQWFDIRFGQKFRHFIYLPQLFFVFFSYILSPVWRRLDERYHLRYGPGEDDDIEDIEPFVTY